MAFDCPGPLLLSGSGSTLRGVALIRNNSRAIRRLLKRRRKNERRYRHAFRWNTYVRPLLNLLGRIVA